MSKTYFAAVSADVDDKNQVVYINNLDNSLGWKQALGCKEENKNKKYYDDPLTMCLASKQKAVYVKTQFDEVILEINDQNEVEV